MSDKFIPKESRLPPEADKGVVLWLLQNIFYSLPSSLISLILVYLLGAALFGFADWAFINAVWSAESRKACTLISPDGACWAGVISWSNNLAYGRYPTSEQWRVDFSALMLILWILPIWLPKVHDKNFVGLSAIFCFPVFAGYFLLGGEWGWLMHMLFSASASIFIYNYLHSFMSVSEKAMKVLMLMLFAAILLLCTQISLEYVSTNMWGGLFLTLVVAGIGICVSLPGGILLELGRRSDMKLIKYGAIVFVELFRSVPLITVLFMSVTMMPLFLPEGLQINKLLQAIVGISLFSSAYMAENIRGGIAAIPEGQYEAARSLGLSYFSTMRDIILPQGLKLAIPNIVSSFIDQLRDTTLVSIIGLFDFLLMLRAIGRDPTWLGLYKEPFVFGALIFFILCFGMSKYSQHLEKTVGQGDTGR